VQGEKRTSTSFHNWVSEGNNFSKKERGVGRVIIGKQSEGGE